MRKILGTLGVTVLAGITAAALATPAAAAACVPVEAVPATEAVYETVELTPAQPAVPAIEEVSHLETTDWTTDDQLGEEWVEVDRREVVTTEAVPAWTEVITNDDEIPAAYERTGWVLEAPDDGRTWVQIAERYVVDVPSSIIERLVTPLIPAVEEQGHYEQGEMTDPGQPYIAPTDAVYEIEYQFKHKLLFWKEHWSTNPNWNAENNDHSLGWYATGVTRNGALITPADPGQPYIAPTYGPDVWIVDVAAQPEVPAVYETIVTEEQGHTEYKFAWYQPYVPPTTYTVEHEAIEQVSHLEFIFERTVIDVAAVPGVDAVPAVTEQVLVTAAVPATEAVRCTTEPRQPLFSSSGQPVINELDAPSASDELAHTGADGIGVAAALGLLLLGVGMVVVARRRRVEI